MDLNKKINVAYILLILVGVILRVFLIGMDITGEETDFLLPAISLAETGRPIFYQSEQIPFKVGLYHPPFYLYTLSIAAKLTTWEPILRSINVLAIFLTAVIIYYFCKYLILDEKRERIGLLASALFLINYYVLSSSLILDIDGLSTLFTFSFLFFTLRAYQDKRKIFIFLSIISLLLSIFNRYVIAFIVYLSLLALFIFRKETRHIAKNHIVVGISAGLIFFLLWGHYSVFVEPGSFFSFIEHNNKLGSEQFSSFNLYISSFALNLAQLIRLISFPALALFFLSLKSFYRERRKDLLALYVYTLVIFLFFILVPRPAFGFPRYFLTMTPGFFIIISFYCYKILDNVKFEKIEVLLVALCAVSSLLLLIFFNPQLTLYRNDGLIKATNLPDFIFNLSGTIPILSLILIRAKKNSKQLLVSFLLVILITYSLFFNLKLLTHDSKIKEVGEYVKSRTDDSEVIIAPKAIAYYAERKAYINDYYKPPLKDLSLRLFYQYFIFSYQNKEMDLPYFWGDDIYGGIYYDFYKVPDEKVMNSKYAVLNYKLSNRMFEKKIGDFYIYKIDE